MTETARLTVSLQVDTEEPVLSAHHQTIFINESGRDGVFYHSHRVVHNFLHTVHRPENGTCQIRTKQALYISTDAKCCYDGYGGRSSCGYGDGI